MADSDWDEEKTENWGCEYTLVKDEDPLPPKKRLRRTKQSIFMERILMQESWNTSTTPFMILRKVFDSFNISELLQQKKSELIMSFLPNWQTKAYVQPCVLDVEDDMDPIQDLEDYVLNSE